MAATAATLSLLLISSGCRSAASTHSPQVVAHRGGSLLAPENTLAAFRAGIASGADVLELDLHQSSDGELIVIHDAKLERTTGRSGSVSLYPKEALIGFEATTSYQGDPGAGDTTIPSFASVLELVAEYPDLELQVEIKVDANKNRYPEIEDKSVAALRDASLMDRAVIISFDQPTLQSIQTLAPELPTGLLVGSSYLKMRRTMGAKAIVKEIVQTGVQYVGIDYRALTTNLYRALRKTDLIVGVWTVNSEEELRKYIALGVDFITTDDPALLASLL
ncbi:MAG TPA: glycerophosphodiester phosphodiesterase [Sphaerochaeta sp.]|nr:glycerophosphodiester phosphodiesterase [Sphaerochaeta sp.]